MEIGGEEAQEIVNALQRMGEATDEELEKTTEIRVNTVRKVLYSLHEMGLADFKRIRDKESGWYYYYWHLETKRLPEIIRSRKMRELEDLRRQLEKEKGEIYYWCGNEEHPKMTLDEAFEYEFQCPVCGKMMMQYDNTEKVRELSKRVEELEVELGIRKKTTKRSGRSCKARLGGKSRKTRKKRTSIKGKRGTGDTVKAVGV